MTVRNLEFALAPLSIAVIGASSREGSVGAVVLRNILDGGFAGAVYPVNPKYDLVAGLRCWRRIEDLPAVPDLAVIMTPPATVPDLIGRLGARGTRVAVVITAGIGEADGLRQRMLDAARPHLMRIIGPNTIGLLAPRVSLNASFAHLAPARGRLGLISQSGAIVASIIDWAAAEGIGFSEVLSLGDMADVDVGDALNLLATDDKTSAILMYLESIPAPRKFMSAARAAARLKPVIAVKPGRHAAAAQAARTHTGALSGADRVVDAALRRAGVIRVGGLEDLFEAASITSRFPPMRRGRVAILTNGGGAGVLAVDALLDEGSELAALGAPTLAALDAVLPATWSHANPVDIVGDASPERYTLALEAVAADPGVDVLLAMNCPTGLSSSLGAARAVAGLAPGGRVHGKPLLACWLGQETAEPARRVLLEAGVASFPSPAGAAEAVSLLSRWALLREALERAPASAGDVPVDVAAVRRVLAAVAAEGRAVLTEPEAKAVVAACGIEVPPTLVCRDPAAVADAARTLLAGSPAVVVKLLSRTLTHKSDVGGVVLDIRTPEAAAAAAVEIAARLAARQGGAVPDGFSVQPMVRRPGARELIVGLHADPDFGPTVLFGAGGTDVEIVDDVATGLAPLDDVLAADLIARTRVSRLLPAHRGTPAADEGAIVRALLGLSQLAVDFPAVVALDVNPLLADAAGVVALDARIEIDPARLAQPGPNAALAVRPYPAGWAGTVHLGEEAYLLRPIRPGDAALYPAFLARVTPEDMRRRFLAPVKVLSSDLMVRLTQLDYDRDIAFVAIAEATGELAGIVRYGADPDRRLADFGLLVRSDLQGRGLGVTLLNRLVDYARAEGVERLEGLVLKENERMQALCRTVGFTIGSVAGDLGLVRASLDVRAARPTVSAGSAAAPA